jgi:DNA-binding MarR family transcriptional regulator
MSSTLESYINSIEALNEHLLDDLDKESMAIDAREAEANRALADCRAQREANAEKRNAILKTKDLQLAYLNNHKPPSQTLPPPPPSPLPPPPFQSTFLAGGPAQNVVNPNHHVGPGPLPPPPQSDANRAKTRARIGPQRYLILIDIHQNGPTTTEEIAGRTELSIKRVKDQVRSDINDGVLDEVEVSTGHPGGVAKLRLSNSGGELLRRFVEYRTMNNKLLPTKAEALGQHETEGVFS